MERSLRITARLVTDSPCPVPVFQVIESEAGLGYILVVKKAIRCPGRKRLFGVETRELSQEG